MQATTSLSFLLLFLIAHMGFSQVNEDNQENIPTFSQYEEMSKYQTRVILNNYKIIRGHLYQVSNDEISLLPFKIRNYAEFRKYVEEKQTVIRIPAIRKVITKKKGISKKRVLIGSGVGFTFGLLSASLQSDSASDFLSLGLVCGVIGGLVSATNGYKPVKYNLNEKAELEELKKRGIIFSN